MSTSAARGRKAISVTGVGIFKVVIGSEILSSWKNGSIFDYLEEAKVRFLQLLVTTTVFKQQQQRQS